MSSRVGSWARVAVVVLVAVFPVVLLFATKGWASGGVPWVAVSILVLLLISWREVRHGKDDERTMGIKVRAGYYAYMISLYLWLALRYFGDRLDASETFVIGMTGMALAFGLSWVVLTVKERS